ncbi:dTMP kinase [Candidatus Kaiserbacteria bacterium CG10_big_fil_rev_8_21_14_0_10_44_10]|uniref:Thymidylate kinase n=1 Tax=Candidatus Kaiserbacteria bacterium CG10_big_fil_rev_8_21_14_0_10_44_10 TaxID=1974606 RepID=A0A2H0UH37_9BACT|nr:MAG: dTMP kinase [Candidatus Kaiserbacteria bacterium CG10_big_fil_rev_8_21_14_0_10_44_10]
MFALGGVPMIIEIEGIDGAGKTMQARLLKQSLEEKGHKVLIVKDLESTEIGRKIKEMFVSDTPRTKAVELFGFLCCKAHLFSEVVGAAVRDGNYVLCDRGFGSLISYFEAHGFERKLLEDMASIAVPNLRPSLTILLDLPVKEAIRRNMSKQTFSKFDNMGARFFEKQRQVYQTLSQQKDWRVVDAQMSIDRIHEEIMKLIGP